MRGGLAGGKLRHLHVARFVQRQLLGRVGHHPKLDLLHIHLGGVPIARILLQGDVVVGHLLGQQIGAVDDRAGWQRGSRSAPSR